MGITDTILGKLRHEFIDIIEWTDDSSDTMLWRFPRYENEIKYNAKLTVRESQVAVFVNEGKIADVYEPGMYSLTTQNMPILTTLKGWKYGFKSPFKAEVYFVNTKNFTDRKWGTPNPIMMRDKEFGPIRLRAHGNYAVKIKDAGIFIKEIAGTDGHFTIDEVTDQLRDMIVSRFADALGESDIPILDLAANYDELSQFMRAKMNPEFFEYGLELTKLLVENISLPKEVEEALDKRSSMGIIGDLGKYAQFQAANAMEAAAKNPGGEASAGIGMGMGFAMANQMGQMFNPAQMQQAQAAQAAQQPNVPPPLPGAVAVFVAVNGEQSGPFNMATLLEKVKSGELTKETLVWKKGMTEWLPAGEAPGVSGMFEDTPPPIPEG